MLAGNDTVPSSVWRGVSIHAECRSRVLDCCIWMLAAKAVNNAGGLQLNCGIIKLYSWHVAFTGRGVGDS